MKTITILGGNSLEENCMGIINKLSNQNSSGQSFGQSPFKKKEKQESKINSLLESPVNVNKNLNELKKNEKNYHLDYENTLHLIESGEIIFQEIILLTEKLSESNFNIFLIQLENIALLEKKVYQLILGPNCLTSIHGLSRIRQGLEKIIDNHNGDISLFKKKLSKLIPDIKEELLNFEKEKLDLLSFLNKTSENEKELDSTKSLLKFMDHLKNDVEKSIQSQSNLLPKNPTELVK